MSRYNYFRIIQVNTVQFPVEPQVAFGFNSQAFSFLYRGQHFVQYSFDGHTIHGDLNATDASKGLAFDDRTECKVWFRNGDSYEGYGGPVRIESWGGWGHSG